MAEANCESCKHLMRFEYWHGRAKRLVVSQTCELKRRWISHHFFDKFGKECEKKGRYEEMNEAQREQRQYALAVSGGVCEACGKPLTDGQPQGAHRIGNTRANRARYGSLVIDHRLNVGYVCSLKCNARLDISRNTGACVALCRKIYAAEAAKHERNV